MFCSPQNAWKIVLIDYRDGEHICDSKIRSYHSSQRLEDFSVCAEEDFPVGVCP